MTSRKNSYFEVFILTLSQAPVLTYYARIVTDADRWWIGLTDSGQEGTWVWLSDFEVATFTDWAPGMPSVTSRSE